MHGLCAIQISGRSAEGRGSVCRRPEATENAETSAGTNPMRTSVKPNRAAGVARVKSQSVASPVPPAMAGPFTAAIVGTGNSYRATNSRASRSASARCSAGVLSRIVCNSDRSSPEQKASPAPVSNQCATLSRGSLLHHADQLGLHLPRHRVAALGAIQRDGANGMTVGDEDRLIVQASTPFGNASLSHWTAEPKRLEISLLACDQGIQRFERG